MLLSGAISLPFDELHLRDVTLGQTIIDRPGEAIFHCIFVFLNPASRGLEFADFALVHIGQSASYRGTYLAARGASGRTAVPTPRLDTFPRQSIGALRGHLSEEKRFSKKHEKRVSALARTYAAPSRWTLWKRSRAD